MTFTCRPKSWRLLNNGVFSGPDGVKVNVFFFPVEDIFRDSTGLKSSPANQMHGNYRLLHYQELYFFASVLGGWF